MIKQLILKNFGKFKNKVFDFDKITVFYGKNESGKTTIFDSLFIKMTDVGRIGEFKRYQGYDKNKDIFIDIDDEKIPIPSTIFKNILAIRAGEIGLDIKEESFSNLIFDKIMASDVNLTKMKAKIDFKASTNRSCSLNKEKESLIEKINKLKNDRQNLLYKIEEIKKTEKNITKFSSLILEKEKELEEKKEKLKKIEEEIQIINKKKEYKIAKENLENILKYNELEKEVKNFKQVDKEIVDNYSKKEKELLSLNKEKDFKKQQIEDIKNEIKATEDAINKSKSEQISPREIEDINTDFRLIKKNNRLNKIFLFSFIAFLALSLPAFFIKQLLVSLILLFLGIIFLFIYIFNNKNLSTLKAKLIKRFPDLKVKDNAEIEKFILRKEYEAENRIKSLEELEKKYKELKLKEDQLLKDFNSIIDQINILENQIREFLFQNGGKSINELSTRLGEQNRIINQKEELKEKILKIMPEAGSIENIKNEMLIKIEKLEHEGIVDANYSDSIFNKFNMDKKRLEEDVFLISEEINRIKNNIEHSKGQVSSMVTFIEEYSKIEEKINEEEKNLEEIRQKQKAYGKISMILSEIMEDTSHKFNIISNEISGEFSEFFPHFKKVEIRSFKNSNDLLLNDKNGELREIENLSTGTRDLFLLSFRLLLAKKFNITRFLIFDEPFLTLDHERINIMLQIVKKFYNNHDWQLIFLTKDDFLKERIIETFGNMTKVVELD